MQDNNKPIGAKMGFGYLSSILLLLVLQTSVAELKIEHGIRTEEFISPEIVLEPGLVSNKYYYNVDFPRGHIAIKDFIAEVIDEKGNSVPLHETYLHHWIMVRYYQRKGVDTPVQNGGVGFLQSDHIVIKNSGICDYGLSQYFGLGSETRRTETVVPDPYGIEVGDTKDIPEGYEERWLLNVHAIDTRGAEDKLGCTECTCDFYNVTLSGYIGGLRCCHDGMRCRVKDGFEKVKRSIYLRYTVKYLDWDTSIVPVKIYIFDVTDIWMKADESKGLGDRHHCQIEFNVESCPAGVANDECIHKKSVTVSLPTGGDVIYGVGHQHAGGIGAALYGEGGREICSSTPIYGNGEEPGNEAGYIVGMSTCYPSPGSVKISDGEMLTLVSMYNSTRRHTGVMSLFYLLIADPVASPNNVVHASTHHTHSEVAVSNVGWTVALFGAAVIGVVIFVFQGRSGREEGYEAIVV